MAGAVESDHHARHCTTVSLPEGHTMAYTALGKGGPLDGHTIDGLPDTADGKPHGTIWANTESRRDVPYDFTGGYAPHGGEPVYVCRDTA